jgi:hypothetical protein
MRRTAAVVAFLLLLDPTLARAQQAPRYDPEMLIQAGWLAASHSPDPRLGGTIGLVWTPWPFGGMWSELGVIGVPSESYRYSPPFGFETKSNQHLEASVGLMITGGNENSVCPYLRGGVGAYRIESDFSFPTFLANVPIDGLASTTSSGRTHWNMGGTFAFGARFGPPSLRAMPTFEARVQLESGGPGASEALLSVLGGVWFR